MGLSLVLLTGAPKAQPSLLESPGSTAAAATGQGDSGEVDIDATKVEFVDGSLKPKLEVLRTGSRRTSSKLLAVFVGVRNNTGRTLAFEVATIYRDKNGNALNRGSWIRLSLKPHEEIDYKSSSLSDDAADFTVRVRKPLAATASTHD